MDASTLSADAIEAVLDDAKRICVVPAPTFAEQDRAALVSQLFGQAGFDAEIDEVGNVIAALDGSTPGAILFAAHLDTVFPADQPIEIHHDRDLGRISGPGIGDNALGVAALLHLARRFSGASGARGLVLAGTVGEEGLGDLRGAKHLVSRIPCEAFVAVEGGMLGSIRLGGVGSTRYRITYRGPGGHSWNDRGTASAVHGLVERAASFVSQRRHPALAINIGRIEGGTSINTIAAEATIELDLRSEDADALSAASLTARAHFEPAPDGLEALVEPVGERPSGRTAPDHPLVQAARRARRKVGLPEADEGMSSTDANAAYGRGIPAITVGITRGANAHRPNEYVDTEPVGQGLLALELLVRELS